jgi:hypothetical protein
MASPEIPLPPTDVIAREVAWLNYASRAVNLAGLHVASRSEAFRMRIQVASEVGPAGTRLSEHSAYPVLLATAARDILPNGSWQTASQRREGRDSNLAAFINDNPELEAHILSRSAVRPGDEEVRLMATADAVRRLDLAERRSKERQLSWPAGVVAAAAIFNGDIRCAVDRAVYNHFDEISDGVKAYEDVRPRHLPGINDVYEHFGRGALDDDGMLSMPNDGTVDLPYDMFWEEITQDRQRFVDLHSELSGSS